MSDVAQAEGGWIGWGRRGTVGAAIPASLGFEDVVQRFGEVEALKGVNLSVEPGEIVCLLGQSGCGKSTLLRLAAGVDAPVSGRILLDGREVASPTRFVEPDQRGVGLMFQDYALFPHLSVAANVAYGIRGLPAAEARATALRALDRVGLAAFAGHYPHMLSGGEQQRVALARAVAPRPGVLLMDEPFSNLDRRLRDSVRDETVTLLRETGATSIIVTHDPEDAMRIADRIVLMRAGRIVQVGTAEELYRRPANLFAARFFCDFNEIPGTVGPGGVDTPFGRIPTDLAPGTPAVVCVRPQSIKLRAAGFCLPGRVKSRRFLGESEIWRVVVDGIEQPLTVRTGDGLPFKAGEDVGVDIAREEVLVFGTVRP